MGYFWGCSEIHPNLLLFLYIYIYNYNTSTHSVYIDFNMAKIRTSHVLDPLCIQLHLSYTPRISYLHTNVLCSLFTVY